MSIIKNPMDLSTAQAKLDNGMYANRQDFVKDVRLITSNCFTYNPVASPVRRLGEAFESYFTARAYPRTTKSCSILLDSLVQDRGYPK
jgi:type II secretory pathway component PulK